MRLLTAEQMSLLDRRTIEEIGIPGVVLMENAGSGATEAMLERWADSFPGPVLVLAGKGNNGGDGYVIARHLINAGWVVKTVVLAGRNEVTGDAAVNLNALQALGGEVVFAQTPEMLAENLAGLKPVIIVDAMLGTGLQNDVRGLFLQAVEWTNQVDACVCAIDVPSGLNASTGQILGDAVQADLTVTFAFAKIGHAVYPGTGCCGDVVIVDIGIPPCIVPAEADAHLVTYEVATRLTPTRPTDGHKGVFGHLLTVGGSRGKMGAAVLAASGGLRSGAGLVTVACPASCQTILDCRLDEAMSIGLPEGEGHLIADSFAHLEPHLAGKQAVALGPGIGQQEGVADFVRKVVSACPVPLVIDADGLNALAEDPSLLRSRPAGSTVMTPHPGEMARLLSISVPEVEADRLRHARNFAAEFGVALVLKGARSIIASPDGRCWINASGNPVMAAGGSGDVLTGLIGGLLAQGFDSVTAAVLGVFVHGAAADHVAGLRGKSGLYASEVAASIPDVWFELSKRGENDVES